MLLLSCLMYIMVDTAQIPGISGTLRAVNQLATDRYLELMFEKALDESLEDLQ